MSLPKKIGVAIATLTASVVMAASLSGCASQGASAQGAGAVVPAPAAPMPAQNACKNRATCKAVVAPPVGCKGSNSCHTAQ